MKRETQRAKIIVRDHKHLSTDDINRAVVGCRSEQRLAEDEATKAQATLTRARKTAAIAKETADALETIVDARN